MSRKQRGQDRGQPRGMPQQPLEDDRPKSSIPYLQIGHAALDFIIVAGVSFYFYKRTSDLQAQIDQLKVDLVMVAKYLAQVENSHIETINNGQDIIKKTSQGFGKMIQDMENLQAMGTNLAAAQETSSKQIQALNNHLKQAITQINALTTVVEELKTQNSQLATSIQTVRQQAVANSIPPQYIPTMPPQFQQPMPSQHPQQYAPQYDPSQMYPQQGPLMKRQQASGGGGGGGGHRKQPQRSNMNNIADGSGSVDTPPPGNGVSPQVAAARAAMREQEQEQDDEADQ